MTTTAPAAKAPAGDRPALRVLPTAAAMASWAYLRSALRQPQTLSAVVGGLSAAVVAVAVLHRSWWELLALPAVGAVGITAMLVVFVLARRGGNRVLLMARTPAGQAGLVLHPKIGPDGPYWLVENMWARHHGPRASDRTQRPGAVLLRRATTLAAQHQVTLLLVAADQALAAKVYLPAGFGYADEAQRARRRPRMTLPPAAL